MYSIWYLTKSYGKVDQITELMDRTTFYFVPCVSPDSRAHWFREPSSWLDEYRRIYKLMETHLK